MNECCCVKPPGWYLVPFLEWLQVQWKGVEVILERIIMCHEWSVRVTMHQRTAWLQSEQAPQHPFNFKPTFIPVHSLIEKNGFHYADCSVLLLTSYKSLHESFVTNGSRPLGAWGGRSQAVQQEREPWNNADPRLLLCPRLPMEMYSYLPKIRTTIPAGYREQKCWLGARNL